MAITGFWAEEAKPLGPAHAHEETSVALPVNVIEFPTQYESDEEEAVTRVGVVVFTAIVPVVAVAVPHPFIALRVNTPACDVNILETTGFCDVAL